MAMNRTEIELLIKARNDAQGAFDQLNKQVKSVTGESDKATDSMDKLGKKTKDGGVAAGAAGVAFGLLAERVGRGLVTAFGDTIREANALDRGLIGLGATAKAFGTDANAAQAAAKSLAADGLMNVGEAASGLKNLLAGGFNLPQAIELMNRFKDSAAFGRQGSLEFGQAIVGATEGIKNGNSALVDNAGLTKNLSNILVEAGFSAQDLSKVQSDLNVRTALYNGILKETNPQLGQTALFLDTAQGKQAQFNSQVTIAQQKIGAGLQPVLGQLLSTLAPMVQMIGDNAGAFISLGAAVGAVVIPLAAMKAAAALGIDDLLKGSRNLVNVFRDVQGLGGGVREAINGVGTASGVTFASMGKLGTAVSVVGAAFVGWEIGKAIAQLTGLDKAIERTVDKMTGLTAATAGAQQDVIDRAVAQGADRWIKYADAITYNINAMTAHTKVADDNTVALRKQLDAKLALGQIDRAAYDDAIILLNMRERETKQAENLTKLRTDQAAAARKFRDEIANTGQSVEQLQAAMKKDEDTFKTWAEAVGLSDSTVKQLKDSLTATEKQQEKNAVAAKKAADAQKELLKQLEDQAGILTKGGLNAKLEEYQKFLTLAATQGTPALATAVKALWPEFEKLTAMAKASGLAVENINGVMQMAAEGAGLVLTNVRQFNTLVPLVAGVTEVNRVNTAGVREQIKAQDSLTAAYKQFGITAPEELRKAAQESRTNFEVLRSSGTATTAQLKTAWRQMVDDQKQASGELPSYWEKNVFPGIKRSVETIQTAVQGSFAQMLLGAKSFGEGFQDIWQSLKKGVLQILAEMLNTFINSFLKGILGALSGQQGAMSQAFGGLFSGGTGGVGSLFGGGAGLTGIGGAPVVTGAAGLGAAPGAGGAAGGGGLFGGLGAGLAGGAAAGGAGIGLGMLGKNIFGGSGLKAGGFGAGTGFASGALIGSVVPGIGTIVGGVIGGLSGLITGLLGKSESQKVGDARDKFTANFGGSGTGAGSGFANLAAELAKLGVKAGGGEGGGSLFRNLFQADTVKEFEAAIKAVQVALENAGAAGDELAATNAENSAANVAAKEDEVQALDKVSQALLGNAREADKVDREIKDLGRTTENVSRSMDRSLNSIGFNDAASDAEAAARDIDQAFRGLRFRIPVDYDVAAPPGGDGTDAGLGGGDELPQAAKGVMASRASLVIFGEGGEPEVGGPRSFFKDVFRQLKKEGADSGGGGGGAFAPVFKISTLTPGDTATVIEKVVMPKLLELWRQNRGGSLTNAKSVLGV